MARKSDYTPEKQVEALVTRLREGLTLDQLADRIGKGRSTVAEWNKRYGDSAKAIYEESIGLRSANEEQPTANEDSAEEDLGATRRDDLIAVLDRAVAGINRAADSIESVATRIGRLVDSVESLVSVFRDRLARRRKGD